MNTSVYIPATLEKRFKRYLKQSGNKSKNGVLIKALEEFLEREEQNNQWSQEFLQWKGHSDLIIERENEIWREIEL